MFALAIRQLREQVGTTTKFSKTVTRKEIKTTIRAQALAAHVLFSGAFLVFRSGRWTFVSLLQCRGRCPLHVQPAARCAIEDRRTHEFQSV